MNPREPLPSPSAADAELAAAVFALDPAAGGGIVLRALPGPVREGWLELLAELMPPGRCLRRVPAHITDDRLLGGLDLSATLSTGRPVFQRGLLAEADGGAVVLVMAERLTSGSAAHIGAALDTGQVVLERDGFTATSPARIGVVALDESMSHEESPPAGLLDRLAIHIDLSEVAMADTLCWSADSDDIESAAQRLPQVSVKPALIEGLCGAAMGLGIPSLRAPLAALRVARASAALAGRLEVEESDLIAAARLVLAPRARTLPVEPEVQDDQGDDEGESSDSPTSDVHDDPGPEDGDESEQCTDQVLDAARAALPSDLLAQLVLHGGRLPRASREGKAGAERYSQQRGRPSGVRPGEPRGGARLNVMETLRAAAPWQRLRGREPGAVLPAGGRTRVQIRHQDFRVNRYRHRAETTTVFAVDASGSQALHRLAEVKGAVELLLSECYVRRDRVALIAFRGRGAELLLPATRSLVRAKRCLARLPGGGGTPLAAGIDAAFALVETVRRGGGTPVVVLLTDGRANVGRAGAGGRKQAQADAQSAARRLAAAGAASLLVDTSPRPLPEGRDLAATMGAHYLPLPHADAGLLRQAVNGTLVAGTARG